MSIRLPIFSGIISRQETAFPNQEGGQISVITRWSVITQWLTLYPRPLGHVPGPILLARVSLRMPQLSPQWNSLLGVPSLLDTATFAAFHAIPIYVKLSSPSITPLTSARLTLYSFAFSKLSSRLVCYSRCSVITLSCPLGSNQKKLLKYKQIILQVSIKAFLL